MRTNRLGGGLWTWSALLVVALATIGLSAMAQQPRRPVVESGPQEAPQEEAKQPDAKAKAKAKGGLRIRAGEPPEEMIGEAADPLPGADQIPPPPGADAARPAAPAAPRGPQAPVIPQWPFHYQFQLQVANGGFLSCRYYPSQLGDTAPVILMIHESGPGRSGKDFEDPVLELENKSLAGHLQGLGYASLVLDLRGHGPNPRIELTPAQWRNQINDLQAAYRFLVDRHNRRELNLAKFGVLAVGDGGNLALSWARMPGAAVTIEGRLSDLAALALVSPKAEINNISLPPMVAAVAPRLPMLLMAGQGDEAAVEAIRSVQGLVERQRLSRVALLDARLQGYTLLRFTPEATRPVLRFLENTLKVRVDEWEPRYNLDPVVFTNVLIIDPNAQPQPEAEAAEAAAEAEAAEAAAEAEAEAPPVPQEIPKRQRRGN